MNELLPPASWWLIAAGMAGMLIAAAIYHQLRPTTGLWAVTGLVMLASGLVIVAPAWFHPTRKRLSGWVSRSLLLAGK